MSPLGRFTILALGGAIVLALVGILVLLDALTGRIDAPCLAAVAPPPDVGEVAVTAREGTWRVEHADGLVMEVPRPPRRIISTLPGITEMLVFLGAGDRLVAVSPWCDHPPWVDDLPEVRTQPFDAESALALEADLIVADLRLHRRDLGVMRRHVGGLLLLDTSRSLGHLGRSMRTLARLVGTEEAEAAAVGFAHRLEAVVAEIQRDAPASPPRVLAVAGWDPLYVMGRGSLIDDLLRVCGCVNVACDLRTDASGTFSAELVIARRPDVILTPGQPIPASLRERWARVPAVAKGRFIDGSADELVRAGPRILDALGRLAAQLREAR